MSKKDQKANTIRIVAVGDGAVGKTCMLTVFKGDPFPEDYEPTIFENHHEMRTFQGKQFCLHLWDTAGQEEYDRLRPMSYAKCDCVLICFALNNADTLKSVESQWILECKEYCPKAAIVLVGTKADLWKPSEDGAITQDQIDEVAKRVHAFKAINCSAKTRENVENVFDLAIAAVLSKNGDKGCSIA